MRFILKDFIKILKETNRYRDESFNKSFYKYTFGNGSYIEFFSVEDSTKLRGARRDILYVNEANNITFDAYNELSIRTKKEVYLDFNPANEFWVHTNAGKSRQCIDFVNVNLIILGKEEINPCHPQTLDNLKRL